MYKVLSDMRRPEGSLCRTSPNVKFNFKLEFIDQEPDGIVLWFELKLMKPFTLLHDWNLRREFAWWFES